MSDPTSPAPTDVVARPANGTRTAEPATAGPITATRLRESVRLKADLRVICAWCGEVLAKGRTGARTSHGLCPDCYHRLVAGFQPRSARSRTP